MRVFRWKINKLNRLIFCLETLISSWYIDNICTLSTNIKFICRAFETGRKVSFSAMIRRECKWIWYFQTMYVYSHGVYPALSKSPKTTAILSKKNRNKHCSNSFLWCSLWSLALLLLPFLNMNQVPEKRYLDQWRYITKIYPVNVLTAQIEQMQDIRCFLVSQSCVPFL